MAHQKRPSVSVVNLPDELLCIVLEYASSPEDLYSHICTSKAFYAAFQYGKASILSSVLQRVMPLEIWPDALAALEASKLVELIQDSPDLGGDPVLAEGVHGAITAFLNEYHRQRKRRKSFDLHYQSLALSLYPLYHLVKHHVQGFVLETLVPSCALLVGPYDKLPRIAALEDHSSGVAAPTLSRTESGRLQRAFFRFEIFRKCLHVPVQTHPWRSAPPGSFDLLFRPFPSSEVDEMACVYQYFVRKVEKIFDQLEDDFVHDVQCEASFSRCSSSSSDLIASRRYDASFLDELTLSKRQVYVEEENEKPRRRGRSTSLPDRDKSAHSRLNESTLRSRSVGGENEDEEPRRRGQTTSLPDRDKPFSSSLLEWYGLNFFGDNNQRDKHVTLIENLISRGLPFLKQFFGLDDRQRRPYIPRQFSHPLDRELIMGAFLRCCPRQRGVDCHPYLSPVIVSSYPESLDVGNLGWVWGRNHIEMIFDCASTATYSLRVLGYCIWDRWRLFWTEGRLLGAPVVSGARPRPFPFEEIFFCRISDLTVSERLKGVRIKNSVLEAWSNWGEANIDIQDDMLGVPTH